LLKTVHWAAFCHGRRPLLPLLSNYCILFATHCQISERAITLKLEDCLAAQTWRHLQAIRLAHGLGFGAYLTKSQAVERLAAWLGGEEHLRVLDALPDEARATHRMLTAVLIQAWGCCLARGYLIPNAVDRPAF